MGLILVAYEIKQIEGELQMISFIASIAVLIGSTIAVVMGFMGVGSGNTDIKKASALLVAGGLIAAALVAQ